MVEINRGIVCNVIVKAREINVADDLTMPDDQNELTDTEWKEILAEYQADETYLELKALISDLEPDQQLQLIALMYIGRGDFKKNEWISALIQANSIPLVSRANYLISKHMLADYLEEGLAIFGFSCDE